MCTAFVRRGNDVISGFNMDINPEALMYEVYAEDDGFYVGMQVPDTNLKVRIHGVNRNGNFANQLNNMDFHKAPYREGEDAVSLDRLIHAYLSGVLSFDALKETAEKKEITQMATGIVDIPTIAFHSLITDSNGRIMMLEPGNGFSLITEKYAALSNFSMMELPKDFTESKYGYYGKDRYDTAMDYLRNSSDDFSVEDGLQILESVKQTGRWATKVSFVYSRNENAVYFCQDGQFDRIKKHKFNI